jgi:plasmid stabilization system protein ParE
VQYDQIHHIEIVNLKNAIVLADRIENSVNSLQELPTGRFGRVPSTYEKVVAKTSYIISFSKTESEINIPRIIHTSQDRP